MDWILTVQKIAQATGGVIRNCDKDEIIKSVSTDSRSITEGALFFALSGENFNGHRFVANAVESGAVCCVVNADEGDFPKMPTIAVEDTHKALRDLAAYYRSCFDIPVVGITGSVGKTSTKEMISCVLSMDYNTHKTNKNFNNEIGLPLTVFDLSGRHEIMVLEMGMSDFGEISRLTAIAKPDTAVITNIGVSHIEHLGSQQGIRQAKFEILEGLMPDGAVILNGDDPLLWEAAGDVPFETLCFGITNPNCDLIARNIRTYSDGSAFTVKVDGTEYTIVLQAPGQHHIYNALAAILVGLRYNIDMEKIVAGIRKFLPDELRQSIVELRDYRVIKDCYNASPTSMKSGLEVLSLQETEGRRVAILADMLELGDISDQAHREVGGMVKRFGVDCLVTIGEKAALIAEGALDNGMPRSHIYRFASNDEAEKMLRDILKKDDLILIKGSRGMHLEEIADAIAAW